MRFYRIILGFTLAVFAVSASATLVSGGGLQSGLNAITDGSFYDVNSGQVAGSDELFALTSSKSSTHKLIFEFAGFEATTSFGIYDPSDTSIRLEIFPGSACGEADTSCVSTGFVEILERDNGSFGFRLDTGVDCGVVDCTPDEVGFASASFGYYLDVGATGNVFFSQAGLNTDVGDAAHDNTSDHMIMFQGDGSLSLDISGGTDYAAFTANEFILAWEDLRFPGADYDYSDFVVLVESIIEVPEPATLALLGIGLIGLGFSRRRRIAV